MVRKIRWFRVYDDLVDDPKVQCLSGETFKALVNLWCLTSQNGGTLPPDEHIAFKLRIPSAKVNRLVADLTTAGLIDETDDGALQPHNWNARQFKAADVSTSRVQRFRKRMKRVSETPPDTETETDTEKGPEANASDAGASPAQPPPPDDPRTKLFRESLGTLARITGKTPDSCRSLVGRWLKLAEDEAIHVVAAIEDADRNGVADPTAWIAQRLNTQFRGGKNGRRDDDGKSLLAAIERQSRLLGPGEVDYQPRLDPVLSLPAR